jgi:hypothetical protein
VSYSSDQHDPEVRSLKDILYGDEDAICEFDQNRSIRMPGFDTDWNHHRIDATAAAKPTKAQFSAQQQARPIGLGKKEKER